MHPSTRFIVLAEFQAEHSFSNVITHFNVLSFVFNVKDVLMHPKSSSCLAQDVNISNNSM